MCTAQQLPGTLSSLHSVLFKSLLIDLLIRFSRRCTMQSIKDLTGGNRGELLPKQGMHMRLRNLTIEIQSCRS